ncbi:MAG: NAD-dependent succinate-semialdehyde dehydrogenase [Cyanobacteria bacterium J06641_5]
MSIATVSPATGEQLKVFSPLSAAEIDAKIARAHDAFAVYRHTSFAQRSRWLQRAAEILEAERQRFAELMVAEMGKPVREALAEVDKCAWVCSHYAEQAPAYLADFEVCTDAQKSFTRCLPLGVILAVMPWNFPFWQVFRFAAPALMAGNVGLLKPASNVPQCALAIEEIFQWAGLPDGAFQTLLVPASAIAGIVADERIRAATLTGSEGAGASLAAAAGRALKKTVLELGGSDPFIVLESADLEAAAGMGAKARLLNSGQSCIAAKRFIVAEAIADRFEGLLVDEFRAMRVGDPMDPNTQVGPLATAGILAEIDAQVNTLIAAGARVLVGGYRFDRPGNFFAPTILTDIPRNHPAAREEFFGPVALLFRVKDLDSAIALANDSPFGLGASAWTTDIPEQERLIDELDAGATFINAMVQSDPRIPFGGIKRSGYGRELAAEGMREFVNLKTVWIA